MNQGLNFAAARIWPGGRMQAETVQTGIAVSIPFLLLCGWVLAEITLAYGWRRPSSPFRTIGLLASGLMLLATGLAWYVYATSRPQGAGLADALILALAAFVGGGVAGAGLLWPRGASTAHEKTLSAGP